MPALTVEQTLKAFMRRPATDAADPYARVWRAKLVQPGLPIAWEIDVATNGCSLAACIRGLDAAALPFERRFELVGTEPDNGRTMLADGCPRYWGAIASAPSKAAPAKHGAVEIGLDADLFGAVAVCQRRVVEQTQECIRRSKPAATEATRKAANDIGAKVRLIAQKKTTEEAVDEWQKWKRDHEELDSLKAMTCWRVGGPLDPVLWSVMNPFPARRHLDECWIGAIMPVRLA